MSTNRKLLDLLDRQFRKHIDNHSDLTGTELVKVMDTIAAFALGSLFYCERVIADQLGLDFDEHLQEAGSDIAKVLFSSLDATMRKLKSEARKTDE